MIKVILVDDNKHAINYYKTIIDWSALGFQIVSTAIDGVEALKQYKIHRPELVITDVMMPGMTGIDLAESVKKINSDAVIVFLTSFDEFDYARSAINLGVNEYILKHELKAELLIEKLKQLKSLIVQQSAKSKLFDEETLYGMLKHSKTDPVMDAVFPSRYHLVIVEQDHVLPVISELTGIYEPEADGKRIKQICYGESGKVAAVAELERYRYALLCESDALESDMNAFLYALKSKLNETLKSSFSVFLFCEDQTIAGCIAEYSRLQHMPDHRYFLEKSIVFSYYLYHQVSGQTEELPYQKITEALKQAKGTNDINFFLDQLYANAIKKRDVTAFSNLTKLLLAYLLPHHQKLVDLKMGNIFSIQLEQGENWYVAGDIVLWIKRIYRQYYVVISNNALRKYSKEVQKAVSYIYFHYRDSDLGVETIAAQTNLTVNRLNTLFREDTGKTIGKFLTLFRMEKARELLADGQMNVSDIAKSVGYSSLQYFSKAFKSIHGLSPVEYRKES